MPYWPHICEAASFSHELVIMIFPVTIVTELALVGGQFDRAQQKPLIDFACSGEMHVVFNLRPFSSSEYAAHCFPLLIKIENEQRDVCHFEGEKVCSFCVPK